MDKDAAEGPVRVESPSEGSAVPERHAEEINNLRADFRSRLLVSGLRTEAVRAGMIDLDGLKLIDIADAQLGSDDQIVGGRLIMQEFRRRKPWLFGTSSSSSVAEPPASQPLRHKSALEMTDEEYLLARSAMTKSRH